ncbi:MAG: cadherin-like domain-containing protein [Nanoarchaeota archaeon]
MKYTVTLLTILMLASIANAQVYINEFLAQPTDWAELYNSGSSAINISGWSLRVGASQYPVGLGEVAAGGFFTFNVPDLPSGGATLTLLDSANQTVDQFTYTSSVAGSSWGRRQDGEALWIMFSTPTRGVTNELPPSIANDITVPAFPEDTPQTLNLAPYVSDPNNDTLSFSAFGMAHVTVTFNGYVATITPEANYHGSDQMTINVSDGRLSDSSNQIALTLLSAEDGPTFTSTPVTHGFTGQAYRYDADATDGDGDTLHFSLAQYPEGMSIDTVSGLITWTPSSTGTFGVLVRADDGHGNMANQSYSISVTEPVMLDITDLDAKVDGKSSNDMEDGDTISREAKPGSTLKLNVRVANLFDDNSDNDLEIQNIVVTATVRDIDDGDDLDQESAEFDLDAGDDKKLSFDFNIPDYVDETSYDIDIEVEGEDEDDNEQRLTWTIQLEVEKETHDLRITEASFEPASISCGRSATLNVQIGNFGTDDEDEARLRVRGADLGLDEDEKEIELDSGSSEDDVSYDQSFTVDTDGLEPGTYSATVDVYYDETHLEETKLVQLQVASCSQGTTGGQTGGQTQNQTSGQTGGQAQQGGNVQIEYVPVVPAGGVTAQPVDSGISLSFGMNPLYLGLLIALIVIVLIAVVLAIVLLLRR